MTKLQDAEQLCTNCNAVQLMIFSKQTKWRLKVVLNLMHPYGGAVDTFYRKSYQTSQEKIS